MERLEAIVAQLEGDESLGLEEALALYEQGVALAADCRQRLVSAQLRLSEIPVAAVAIGAEMTPASEVSEAAIELEEEGRDDEP